MRRNKKPIIKKLAEQFEVDLNTSMPITVAKDGSALYKNFIIKKNSKNKWGLYYAGTKDLVGDFFLKTCALLAAKAYDTTNLQKYREIQSLDTNYWINYSNVISCQNCIKKTTPIDRYIILLNKIENSQARVAAIKEEISVLFTWGFV